MYKGFNGVTYYPVLAGARVGRNVIITDPSMDHMDSLKETIKNHGTVLHVFAREAEEANHLPEVLQELEQYLISKGEEGTYKYKPEDPLKVVIHYDAYYRDMGIMLRGILPQTSFIKWKMSPERKLVRFRIPGGNAIMIQSMFPLMKYEAFFTVGINETVVYDIDVKFTTKIFGIGNFEFSVSDNEEPAVIQNDCQRLHPELFRHGIVARFKKATPEGILKANFKSDDDIWQYVTCQGIWAKEAKK